MKDKAKSYQELREELEAIIAKLQDESVDIDQALSLYEAANELAGKLEEYLNTAKHRFEVLSKKSE